jgi:hypothetical protein
VTIANSVLNISCNSGQTVLLTSTGSLAGGWATINITKQPVVIEEMEHLLYNPLANSNKQFIMLNGAGGYIAADALGTISNSFEFYSYNGTTTIHNITQDWTNAYYVKLAVKTGNASLYMNETKIDDLITSLPTGNLYNRYDTLSDTGQGLLTLLVDWIRIRKYIEPAPSFSYSSEETPPTTTTTTTTSTTTTTTTPTPTTTVSPTTTTIQIDYCQLNFLQNEMTKLSNHNYCLDNTTEGKNITYMLNGNQTIFIQTNVTCDYGCDLENNKCYGSPFENFIMICEFVVGFLLFILLIYIILNKVKGRR